MTFINTAYGRPFSRAHRFRTVLLLFCGWRVQRKKYRPIANHRTTLDVYRVRRYIKKKKRTKTVWASDDWVWRYPNQTQGARWYSTFWENISELSVLTAVSTKRFTPGVSTRRGPQHFLFKPPATEINNKLSENNNRKNIIITIYIIFILYHNFVRTSFYIHNL